MEWWGFCDKGRGLAESLSDQGTRLGKAGRQTDLNRWVLPQIPGHMVNWWGNISRPDPVQVRRHLMEASTCLLGGRGSQGSTAILPPTLLGFGLRTEPLQWFGHRGAVAFPSSSVHRPGRKQKANSKKVLASKPLPVACQLPAFVGSQGIF